MVETAYVFLMISEWKKEFPWIVRIQLEVRSCSMGAFTCLACLWSKLPILQNAWFIPHVWVSSFFYFHSHFDIHALQLVSRKKRSFRPEGFRFCWGLLSTTLCRLTPSPSLDFSSVKLLQPWSLDPPYHVHTLKETLLPLRRLPSGMLAPCNISLPSPYFLGLTSH